MNKWNNISINEFKDSYAELPKMYFEDLEGKIMLNTIQKYALKEKLIETLYFKPVRFEIISVNDSYFESLEKSIKNNTTLDSNREFWLELGVNFPFQVSDEYFDGLVNDIKKKIPTNRQPWGQTDWISNLILKPQYLVAASVLIIAIGFGYIYLFNNIKNNDYEISINAMSKADISAYLTSTVEDINIENIPVTHWDTEFSDVNTENNDMNYLIFNDEL